MFKLKLVRFVALIIITLAAFLKGVTSATGRSFICSTPGNLDRLTELAKIIVIAPALKAVVPRSTARLIPYTSTSSTETLAVLRETPVRISPCRSMGLGC